MISNITMKLIKFLSIFSLAMTLASAPAFANELDTAEEAKSELTVSIDEFIAEVYKAWNEHDAEKLFAFYSSDFLSGDGLDKDQFMNLTETLWENYPDIKVESQTRTVRTQDQYATASTIDFFQAKSTNKHAELDDYGELNAISQGQIFLERYGDAWKISSDKTNFELVTVHFGDVKKYLDENQIFFAVPEQVKSGEQYTGTLYFILPENIQATATINQESIINPPDEIEESFQAVIGHKLERLFTSNGTNHNELVSGTIIISEGILEPKLQGLLFLSKRVNVLPTQKNIEEETVVDYPYSAYQENKDKKKHISQSNEQEDSPTIEVK